MSIANYAVCTWLSTATGICTLVSIPNYTLHNLVPISNYAIYNLLPISDYTIYPQVSIIQLCYLHQSVHC